MAKPFLKQPVEEPIVEFDFGPSLGLVTAVLGVGVTARGAPGLIAGAYAISGQYVRLPLSAGADGGRYLVSVTAADAQGQKSQIDLDVLVLDLTWAVPSGTSRYLTPDKYLVRYGLAETIALTDETNAGIIDRTRLFAALEDAAGEIDGSIAAAKIYAVPVLQVDNQLERIAADLTRYFLHSSRMTPLVDQRAKDARTMLREIAKGERVLTIPAADGGGALTSNATDTATVKVATTPKRFDLGGY